MKRFILAAAAAVGLTGTVLAVPDAPGAPPAAPQPRAAAPKFVAPKIGNSFEVILYTTQRPVRVRVTTLLEGKPIDELWRDRMKKLFDYCDRDGDGFLSEKEAKFAFSDAGLSQLLQNGYYQPGQTPNAKFSDLDRDGDGKVSFEEFVASYTRTSSQLLRALPPQPDYTGNAAVTEAMFKIFDINGDGKLTKEELKGIEKLIAKHDSDEDECLSMQELVPGMYDPRFGGRPVRLPVQPPNGQPVGGADISHTVSVYEAGRVPGTVTQQVIKRYDKPVPPAKTGDFELTKEEIGFDDATFKALDTDGNGRLTGEELDVWRTGEPDLDLTLSLAPKAADCVATIKDEKSAEARGFKIKRSDNGRLVVHVGRQPIDFSAFSSGVQYGQASLKQQYAYLFQQASGGKDHVTEKDLAGPNAVNFQFVRVVFDSADRDGDGKLTKAEFDAYFDLQDSFRNLSIGLTPSIQTPSLFQLLDENRDGRLGVRELRTAWTRLIALEEPGAEVITKNIIQPAVTLRLARTMDRYYINQPVAFQPGFNPNGMAPVSTKGPKWFYKMDRNGDGDVSRSEFVGTREEFDAIDTDHDDLISLEEAEAWDKKMREKDGEKPEPKPEPPKPVKPRDRKDQEK